MPTLSEAESKQLVARYGVPLAPERRASTPAQAVAAAVELGLPVAVKLNAPGLAHKSERGLVRLDVGDAEGVRAAATALLAAARPDDGDVDLLVAPMVRGRRELVAGVHVDAHFGPCVMVGFGGVLAEAVADVAFRLVPLAMVDAYEMIDDLRTSALLGELRGEAAVDRDALVGVLLALSRLAAAEPEVVGVDLNPLLVTAEGVPVAVDALVEVREPAGTA
jgi:succinyl-CoA synthetase beta subunit